MKALSSVPAALELSVLIYVTSGASFSSSATQTLHDGSSSPSQSSHDLHKDSDIEKDSDKATPAVSTQAIDDLSELQGVSFLSGKPDLHKILEKAVTSSNGPVSVDGELPISLLAYAETHVDLS